MSTIYEPDLNPSAELTPAVYDLIDVIEEIELAIQARERDAAVSA